MDKKFCEVCLSKVITSRPWFDVVFFDNLEKPTEIQHFEGLHIWEAAQLVGCGN